ncbi:PREDICTED: uncharacterized protein LOC108565714 [Nicrophorus vespilloides]|uniref:Uncharacterized protein LOC108565714 n=1 Tax=Nicrophorus vespilloides TaxID=110193 RepID=A0ABM1N1T8_NICVS|nr:PREDICTED: uncharacterized protein LOC108565714 [Nicrophorus vespilloides]
MPKITLSLVFVIVVSSIHAISSARLECAKDRVVKFEKIIGIRPRYSLHPNLLHQATNDGRSRSITIDCLNKCLEIKECSSFVLFYENASCYWFTDDISNLHEEDETLYDADVAWFRKTCFHEPKICDRIWTFERIPGATLVGNNTKQLPKAVKRSECQQACLNETTFECRSAKFRIQNYSNFRSEASGLCTLSDADRHSVPNAYRASRLDEEYLENQCTKNLTNVFCAFEEFPDVRLGHSDASLSDASESQCRSECDSKTIFGCRGYTLLPGSRSHLFTCLMHGENSKLHGPRALVHHAGAKYYERAPCLNITVTCSRDEMLVRFQPDNPFRGRLYMNGYSDNPECYALGNDRAPITLRLPLVMHRCGILEARSPINRTLMSSTMIIQYNSLVQTQSDRIINVGCVFANDTKKVVVGTGFNVSRDHTGLGTSLINSSVSLPTVDMRIVDLSTNGDISETEIGDDLKLIIEMHPRNNGFDIWAGHLIAMTENGRESILLLDDRGCPTNLDIFPSLQKIYNNDSVTLTSTFQAFKFSSSNILRFSVIVQFCSGRCPSIDCGAVYNANNKRRAVVTEDVSNRKYEEEMGSVLEEMPLEFVLVVRSATVRQDRLIHGENNRILVAGYDLNTNEVCLDFSLLIGIAITWILIQIILLVCCVALIRRYRKHYEDRQLSESVEELHKNFGLGFSNLENARRVRFADGHLT